MKTNTRLLPTLATLALTIGSSLAADRFWDGGSADIAGNGNGASTGGAGTWNTTLRNWDAGGVPMVAWNNANLDTAIFAGTAGAAVEITAPITVGNLSFRTAGYTFTSATPGTNFVAVASGGVIDSVPSTTNALANVELAAGNTQWIFQNRTATNNLGNANILTISKALANGTSVAINGSNGSPVVLTGTLGNITASVGSGNALGFSSTAVTNLANGSISVGTGGATIMRTGGNLNQEFLNKIATTTNTFTIVGNNAGTGNALNLTNFPNASLAFWDNVGTVSFGFTGAITAGSNGYLFGSTRANNTINIGGTTGIGAVTNNILSGTAGLTFITGSLGSNTLNLWGANTYSGNTINNASRTITLRNNLSMQNSAIDTSGAGTYVLGTGSSGTNGNGGAQITTPTIGGLIGSKNLRTAVIANAGYDLMTSLTLNPGAGVTHTYSGIIADSTPGLSLIKSGSGTQVLSTAVNTYSGNTTITGGTLALFGAATIANSPRIQINSSTTLDVSGVTSTFTLGADQTFTGGGTVVATGKTVNIAGTLSPGASPGTLTQDGGTMQLAVGGDYNWQIHDASGAAGTGYDTTALINSGILDLSLLSAGNTFNINLWSLSGIGPDANGDAINFNSTFTYSWTLFSTGSAISGFSVDKFTINIGAINGTSGFSNALGGGAFSVGLADSNTDIVLTFTAVPEPNVAALIGAFGGVLLLRRRR
jgi:fibronectin-binding autotransporter adhesin